MPVITLFQTKGGTGKTTSAFVLAELLAKVKPTTVIDADQNEPFREWELGGGKDHEFKVVAFKKRDEKGRALPASEQDLDRETVIPAAIEAAKKSSQYVIVDTEGSANMTSGRAVALSDLVIITSTGSPLDQRHAKEAIKFIRQTAKKAGKEIPYRVLFTRQKAVAVSRTITKGMKKMTEAGIPTFKHAIIERDAFMAIFGYNATLLKLPKTEVPDPFKGYANAKVYLLEVLETLKTIKAAKAATSKKAAAENKSSTDDKEAA